MSTFVFTQPMAGGGFGLKSPKLYRAVKAHVPKCGEPLVLKKGDMVRCMREDNEYTGWFFCEKGGIQGWVPVELVELVMDVMGRIKEDYSSRELEVAIGDTIIGLKVQGGWVMGERVRTGEKGWVPFRNITEILTDRIQQ